MAFSKAYPGVRLPAPYKQQACGHWFRATQPSEVCPACYGMRYTACQPVAAVVVAKPRRKGLSASEKAAQALFEACRGAWSLDACRAAVEHVVNLKEAA